MGDVESLPQGNIDPYETLEIPEKATAAEIKTAYRKLALRHHPDKAPPAAKEKAHKTFQDIAYAYAILSDERRRKRYDSTGNTAESLDLEDGDFDWTSYFRAQWNDAVTSVSIGNFKDKYQGSGQEKGDVLVAYEKAEGSMNKIFSEIMLSNPLEDEARFRAWIDDAIKQGKKEAYDAYTNESAASKKKRRTRAEREAKEAEEHSRNTEAKSKRGKKEKQEDGNGDLAAMIQQRQESRATTFLDELEAKYTAPQSNEASKNGRRKRTKEEEPPEEAFQRTGQRAAKKQKSASIEEDEDDEEIDLEAESNDSDLYEKDEEPKPKAKPSKRQKEGKEGSSKQGRRSGRTRS